MRVMVTGAAGSARIGAGAALRRPHRRALHPRAARHRRRGRGAARGGRGAAGRDRQLRRLQRRRRRREGCHRRAARQRLRRALPGPRRQRRRRHASSTTAPTSSSTARTIGRTSETDQPAPMSTYGSSKLLGEWFAAEAPDAYVLRVESLFGGPRAKSSIDKILGLDPGRPADAGVRRSHGDPELRRGRRVGDGRDPRPAPAGRALSLRQQRRHHLAGDRGGSRAAARPRGRHRLGEARRRASWSRAGRSTARCRTRSSPPPDSRCRPGRTRSPATSRSPPARPA